ncbi:YbaK/EbsC family protein [soil metagenome]
MATRRTIEFLDGNKVKYVIVKHSPAFAAQDVAASAHVPARTFAKTIAVKLHGQLALAVVPATRQVDIGLLRMASGAKQVEIADASELPKRFEGCQLGTMPPFGNLFGMDTYVEATLAKRAFIAFNAGSHTDVVILRFSDYQRLAHPKLARISLPPIAQLAEAVC